MFQAHWNFILVTNDISNEKEALKFDQDLKKADFIKKYLRDDVAKI